MSVYRTVETDVGKVGNKLIDIVREMAASPVGLGFLLGAGAGLALGIGLGGSVEAVIGEMIIFAVFGALMLGFIFPAIGKVFHEFAPAASEAIKTTVKAAPLALLA